MGAMRSQLEDFGDIWEYSAVALTLAKHLAVELERRAQRKALRLQSHDSVQRPTPKRLTCPM